MAKKNKNPPIPTDEDSLIARTTSITLQPNTPSPAPPLSRSTTEPPLPTYTNPRSDPPPYTPSDPSLNTATPTSPTPSLTSPSTPTTKPPTKARAQLRALKRTIDDGRASSFAEAAYSGGMRAQKSFVKAEMLNHAVKTGNVGFLALNVGTAVYEGGKEARKTWVAAEEVRMKRVGEGKGDGDRDGDEEEGREGEDVKMRDKARAEEEKGLAKARIEEEKALAKARAKEAKTQKAGGKEKGKQTGGLPDEEVSRSRFRF